MHFKICRFKSFELVGFLMYPSKWKSLTFILLMIRIWNSNATDVTEAENTNWNLYHYCALTLTLRKVNLLSVNIQKERSELHYRQDKTFPWNCEHLFQFFFFQFQSYITLSLTVLDFSAVNQGYYNSIVCAPITKFLEVID